MPLLAMSVVFRADRGLDKLYCTLLYVHDFESALWLGSIQALACDILRWVWTQFCCLCDPRSPLVRLGGTEGTNVSGLDGMDGCSKFVRRRNLRRPGDYIPYWI
jgi:hypothetical protein